MTDAAGGGELVGNKEAEYLANDPEIKRKRVYTMKELVELEVDPDQWIVPLMIPKNGKTFVYGDGGTGKTTMMLDLCVAVAAPARELHLGLFPVKHHGPVLVVTVEGSIAAIRRRLIGQLRSRGLRPDEVDLHFCHDAFLLDDLDEAREFEENVERIQPVLTLIDPLDSFFQGDENSARDTKRFRRNANKIIDRFNTSLVIIHHQTKGSSDNKPTLRGSSALRGWADVVIHLTGQPKQLGLPEELKVISVDSEKIRDERDGHLFSVVPMFDGSRDGLVEFAFFNGDVGHVHDVYIRQRALQLLVAQSPLTTSDIAAALNMPPAKVKASLEALEERGFVDQRAEVRRSTSSDGSRTRGVPAWRSLNPLTPIEVLERIMMYERQEMRAALELYEVDPVIPAAMPC